MATTRTEHRVTIAEARNSLGQVVAHSRYAGDASVLLNRGKEAAVVVSVEFYRRALAALGEEAVPPKD